jgi:hypothetical protein
MSSQDHSIFRGETSLLSAPSGRLPGRGLDLDLDREVDQSAAPGADWPEEQACA